MLKRTAYVRLALGAVIIVSMLSACGPTQDIPPTPPSGEPSGVLEVETITASQADLTLSIPKTWEDIAIVYTGSDAEDASDGTQDTPLFALYEKTAHTQNESMGFVWGLYIYTNEAFADRFGDVDPAEVFGVAGYIIGTDPEHIYVLGLPSDVQFLEEAPTSQEQYELLQAESQAVLERFLSDNGIAVNEECPSNACYRVNAAELSQLDWSQEPPLRDEDLQIAVPDFLDKEQQNLYRRAYSFYHLFYGESGDVDAYPVLKGSSQSDEIEKVDVDGVSYYLAQGRYRLWSDFTNAMLSVFTEDCFHSLNQEQIFVEHDGRLCYMDASAVRHPDRTDKDTFELISKTDSEVVFEIIGHYQEETGESFIKEETVSLISTEQGWRVSQFAYPQ